MKISIIIPTYNAGAYLKDCLESIYDQNHEDVEVILINDGSTDESLNHAEPFLTKGLKVLSQENKGQSVARNRGLEIATGTYIWLIDSDDKIAPHSLNFLKQSIASENFDILFFSGSIKIEDDSPIKVWNGYERIEASSPITALAFFVKSMRTNYFVTPCMYIYKREKYNKNLFYPGIIYEDNLFTTNLIFSDENANVISSKEQLYIRRLRGGSTVTSTLSARNFYSYYTVASNLLERSTLSGSNFPHEYFKFIDYILNTCINIALSLSNNFVSFRYRRELIKLFLTYYKVIFFRTKLLLISPELSHIESFVDSFKKSNAK